MDTSTVGRLFKSKSLTAKFLGVTIALFTVLPTAFHVAGDASLNVWQRLEQLSLSVGQMLLTVTIAAIPPSALEDEKPEEDHEQPHQ